MTPSRPFIHALDVVMPLYASGQRHGMLPPALAIPVAARWFVKLVEDDHSDSASHPTIRL
jgi:hypothetical protein